MARYDHTVIEPKWQQYWLQHDTFAISDDLGSLDRSKPKFYALDMFPYPSGAGLHVGHPEGYTATDVVSRKKRMDGYNVLHPMGWDAFGLPTERAAIREGIHPAKLTRTYVDNFRKQIQRLGFSYDWNREVNTSGVEYYKWTQWIFLKLHEQGLAYLEEVPVWWCPSQATVLANEEVKDGRYVDTGELVERRTMKQWMLRITHYAQRLLDDLDTLDWPPGILEMQRQWIGRSEGAQVRFGVEGSAAGFEVFTTRPDTLFGATYCVLAPEHPLVSEITIAAQRAEVEAYVHASSLRSDMDRQVEADKVKTGVFTGAYAINPANGARVPVWVADYVLMSYGTGAIMAVPAQDTRDWDFAQKFGLPIVRTVQPPEDWAGGAYTEDGPAINSGFLDGLGVAQAKAKMIEWLEAQGKGVGKVQFRLRDWLFSRQRYWGEPFPILHGPNGEVRPVPEAELPVGLPHLEDYRATADGQPPLARAERDWSEVELDGVVYTRETNTMPQWAGSCWYYLRFLDPNNPESAFDADKEQYWMPVDLYIGGAEHAVLHLLYARFWHKVLYDCGLVSTIEPFQKLYNQGMILAYSHKNAKGKYVHFDLVADRDGQAVHSQTGEVLTRQVEKMSKSKLNVVNPDEIVDEYGADALRLYELYMGPLDQSMPWQTDGVRGMRRFLGRFYRLATDDAGGLSDKVVDAPADAQTERMVHATIKKVTEDTDGLRFNTAIAAMIELQNHLYSLDQVPRSVLSRLTLILSAYAPHVAEEIWSVLGNAHTLAYEPWPTWDEGLLVVATVSVVVQHNGKKLGVLRLPKGVDEATVAAAAVAETSLGRRIEGKTVRRRIYVQDRIYNVVAN